MHRIDGIDGNRCFLHEETIACRSLSWLTEWVWLIIDIASHASQTGPHQHMRRILGDRGFYYLRPKLLNICRYWMGLLDRPLVPIRCLRASLFGNPIECLVWSIRTIVLLYTPSTSYFDVSESLKRVDITDLTLIPDYDLRTCEFSRQGNRQTSLTNPSITASRPMKGGSSFRSLIALLQLGPIGHF